jgi:hypothetical protein
MTTAPATHSLETTKTQTAPGKALAHEVHELEALHTGLVRHLTVWRDAHETAVFRLGAVMAQMDAIIERIERRQAEAQQP